MKGLSIRDVAIYIVQETTYMYQYNVPRGKNDFPQDMSSFQNNLLVQVFKRVQSDYL